jgi:ATP:ADP antiporter, AAA family
MSTGTLAGALERPSTFRTSFIDVRQGERLPAVRAFAMLFALVAGHTVLETARDALFLDKLPASRLAVVYLVVALAGWFAAKRNLALVRSIGRRNALVVTLCLAAVGTTLLYFRPITPALAFGLYVWSALIGSLSIVQYWLVAAESFTSAQSKRLFPMLSAGGVLGAVIASGLAVLVLSVFPVSSLLPVAALTFLGAALILTGDPGVSALPQPVSRRAPEAKGAGFLLSDKYLARIAGLVVVSTLTLLVLDYLFKSVVAATLGGAALAPFFARYYGLLNAAALVTQLFLASRIVRRLGVVAALGVLPLLLVGGALGLVLSGGGFMLLLATKGADGTLRHSVHRVATELLYAPLDGEARDRVKPVIDSVLVRFTQAAGAGGLIGLTLYAHAPARLLALIVGVLALGWMMLGISLRRPYLDSFRRSLGRGTLEASVRFDDLDLESVGAVIEALSSPDPARAVAAMNLLADAGRTRLIPALILYHDAESVLVRALQVLPDARRSDWIPLAERLLGHASDQVSLGAARALGRHGKLPDGIDAPRGTLRAYLAVQRLRQSEAANVMEDGEVAAILAGQSADCHVARLALLDAIADRPDARFGEVALALMHDPAREVADAALRALASLGEDRFIPPLIGELAVRGARVVARESLLGFGDPALDVLASVLHDPSAPLRVRVHVPRVMAEIGTQRAADLLCAGLGPDSSGLMRYRILRALGKLGRKRNVRVPRGLLEKELERNLLECLRVASFEHALGEELSAPARARASHRLVLGLLADKWKQAFERCFRILAILHPNEDMRTVHFALRSDDRRTRGNALELVDALTLRAGERMRELLRLVVDDMTLGERMERAAPQLAIQPRNAEQALVSLLAEPDDVMAALAAHHALALELTLLGADARRVLTEHAWTDEGGG